MNDGFLRLRTSADMKPPLSSRLFSIVKLEMEPTMLTKATPLALGLSVSYPAVQDDMESARRRLVVAQKRLLHLSGRWVADTGKQRKKGWAELGEARRLVSFARIKIERALRSARA